DEPSERLDHRHAADSECSQAAQFPYDASVEDAQSVTGAEDEPAAPSVEGGIACVRDDHALETTASRPQHERAAAVPPAHELAGAEECERRLPTRHKALSQSVPGEVQA